MLDGIPAILYTSLWHVREMGFLKNILNEMKISHLKILIYLDDYKPGGLITIDGEKGEYDVIPVDTIDGIKYDGAVFGKLKPAVLLMEHDKNLILGLLGLLLQRKIRIKGLGKVVQFGKLVLRCI